MSPGSAGPRFRQGAVRVRVDQAHHLLWSPWAPPILLDARALAVLDALDGEPIEPLAEALAQVEARSHGEVAAELGLLTAQFARHGLLDDGRRWSRWSPSALNRPVTDCDRQAWRLDEADVFDLVVAGRRVTVAVGLPELARCLRNQNRYPVLEPPSDLSDTPIELVFTPSGRANGVHQLFGRAGRPTTRSTDLDVVVRSFLTHLGALEWIYSTPGPVWLDAMALVLTDATVALLPGRARYEWARMARRLAAAGIAPLEAPAVALDPQTGRVIAPPDLAEELAATIGWPRPLPSIRPAMQALGAEPLPVTRVDLTLNDHELSQLVDSGHRPDLFHPAVAAHRLAGLAHLGALDQHPDSPPDPDESVQILSTVTRLATDPTVTTRLHTRVAELVSSLGLSGASVSPGGAA